jgi:GT2 family glycosyltransferase
MKAIPFVSVIIPVYDDYRRLATCLHRLEEQSYPSDLYEVVVIDNGTPRRRVPDIEASFEHVRAVREETPGSYAARNAGIDAASGEVFAFTDADCIPDSHWLERGVAALNRNPNCGLVGGRIDLFAFNEDEMTPAETWEMIDGFPQQKYIAKLNFAATANAFTRRRVIEDVGAFDSDFQSGGDREFGERIAAAGYQLVYADDVRILHPARRSMSSLLRKTVRTTRGDYKRMNKHGEWTVGRGALRFVEACANVALPLPRAAVAFAKAPGDPKTRCKYAMTSALVRWTKECELARLLATHPLRRS